MEPPDLKRKTKKFWKRLIENFLLGATYGLGQALGLTLIFALTISYLVRLLSSLGGTPYLGNILANIVNATQKALENIK